MHTIIDASPAFKGKSKGGLYGDVVEEFDHETGKLLKKLDQQGLSKNTLVIYTSDNGPWNQEKYTKNKKGHPAGAKFWGDSGHLREGKGSCYEGGARAACIIRWPDKVKAGASSNAIFAGIDFMPTFAELCGYKLPNDRKIDGVSQVDLLMGTKPLGNRDSFFYQGNGIRKGKWKYLKAKVKVPGYASIEREQVEELYDLEKDPSEKNNIAADHPEIVAELKQLMEKVSQNN